MRKKANDRYPAFKREYALAWLIGEYALLWEPGCDFDRIVDQAARAFAEKWPL